MFYSIVDLVEQASTQYEGNVAELMIATEFELTGREREEVLRLMTRNLEVMIDSVRLGLNENHSRSGLTGGDAAKLDRYIKSGKTLSDLTVLTAAKNAIAVNEHNAKMGLVCATPHCRICWLPSRSSHCSNSKIRVKPSATTRFSTDSWSFWFSHRQ